MICQFIFLGAGIKLLSVSFLESGFCFLFVFENQDFFSLRLIFPCDPSEMVGNGSAAQGAAAYKASDLVPNSIFFLAMMLYPF